METITPRSTNGIPAEKLDLNSNNDSKQQIIYTRDHFHTEFDTNAYLTDFYTKIEDPAMQLVLTFLPSIVARLPPRKRLADFGAGPTIHVAACFRNHVDEIYLADYLPQNREELQRWKNGESKFDWGAALRMMLTREGKDWSKVAETEAETRAKVFDIFYANCFEQPSIQCGKDLEGKFDIITSVFTMEYCCNTKDEYQTAIKNVVEQVIPGGYFIMGGILEETWCSFGGRKFTCLFITKEFMLDCLREAGCLVDDEKTCYLLEVNGMFLVCAKKAEN
jgi:nicotinamide N-methyltransferase